MKHLYAGLLIAASMTTPALAQDVAEGESLYRTYCATCHGLDADGNGPMGPALILRPTNLTKLQAENDGVFPLVRVIKRIDGRDPLVSHGSPMPVFGDYFEGQDVALKTKAGQPIMTSMPVADLVEWLESIQQ